MEVKNVLQNQVHAEEEGYSMLQVLGNFLRATPR